VVVYDCDQIEVAADSPVFAGIGAEISETHDLRLLPHLFLRPKPYGLIHGNPVRPF
jgi:hypothetical protein